MIFFTFILLLFPFAMSGRGPKVAPYSDVCLYKRPRLAAASKESGIKAFTLAFIVQGTGECEPYWGGQIPLDDSAILTEIQEFKAIGGEVIASMGGANGPYLESSCKTPEELAAAYIKILDTVGTRHLDIDIESSIPIDLMNKALAIVQNELPSTTVSFTVQIQDDNYGITPQAVDILKSAVKNGVRVDIVNPMTMDFWTQTPSLGDAIIKAAESTLRQMKQIWTHKSDSEIKQMLGVTPMIGVNDNGKVFEIEHANQLLDWAKRNEIGKLAFWSLARDNGNCPGGGVSPSCSGIQQQNYEFSKIFAKFNDQHSRVEL